MNYHTPEQEAAWRAIESTLSAWLAAECALKLADASGDDAKYPTLLREALRAERELEGAWMHYHRV